MALHFKTIDDLDLNARRVILRVAFDVPLAKKGKTIHITDNSRIKASIPTIKALIKKKARIVILSWLGRPEGKPTPSLSLRPIAKELSRLLKKPVAFAPQCIGPKTEKLIANLKEGEILLLENVRFEKGEINDDPAFLDALSRLGDCLVFDAFAQSHRAVPSVTGLLSRIPCIAAGESFMTEINTFNSLLTKPAHPFIAVMGGAKISDKIETLQAILKKADVLLVGGAMAHAFLKAQNIPVGASYLESSSSDPVALARKLLLAYGHKLVTITPHLKVPKIILPHDLLAAPSSKKPKQARVINIAKHEEIPPLWQFLDIGPETAKLYKKILLEAKTIFWNGPMGMNEIPEFAHGTKTIITAIATSKGQSIIGGGDTATIVHDLHQEKSFDHVSTGGGASLEYLAHRTLPVLPYLTK